MKTLVVDTETGGLFNDRLSWDHPAQPRLVELACLLFNENDEEVSSLSLIVRPEGWEIPDAAARVHGITTEMAYQFGTPLPVAIACYTNLRARADVIVAHNLEYDERILESEIRRLGVTPREPGPANRSCTMKRSTPVLRLPPTERMRAAGIDRYKSPNLGEAYRRFFHEEPPIAHRAMADARACARVHFHLRDLAEA